MPIERTEPAWSLIRNYSKSQVISIFNNFLSSLHRTPEFLSHFWSPTKGCSSFKDSSVIEKLNKMNAAKKRLKIFLKHDGYKTIGKLLLDFSLHQAYNISHPFSALSVQKNRLSLRISVICLIRRSNTLRHSEAVF